LIPVLRSVVSITPNEAFQRKLPAIGFTVDISGISMQVTKFPEENCYLKLIRPPQGSIEFIVDCYQSSNHNQKELRKSIMKRFSSQNFHPLIFGSDLKVRIDGIDRIAKQFFTGTGLKRKEWVSALIPLPRGGPYGLLLSMGCYIGSSNTKGKPNVTKQPVHRHLLESFKLNE
jgi:hypothetical protein